MLATGAHVKIGDYEYLIDEGEDGGYIHSLEPLFSNNTQIVGSTNKESNRPDLLHWSFDDFSGGEGYKFFNPDDPVTYWKGNNNPRERGAITAPPTTTDGTGLSTALSEAGKRVFFATVGDRLYMASSRQLYYTTDGIAWNDGVNLSLTAGHEITGMCSDENYVYIAAHADPASPGTRTVVRANASAAAVYVSAVSSVLPFFDLAVLEGYLYGWTGRNLVKYSLNPDSVPLTHSNTEHKVYNPWDENIPSGFIGRMVQSEQSLFFLTASKGQTRIYEWRKNTPTPIWSLPSGFHGKALGTANGALYVLGNYQDRGALFGMSVASRNPLFLTFITPSSGTTDPVALSGGPGYQVLIGDAKNGSDGTVYIYDAEQDGLSSLGNLSSWGAVGAVATFGKYRIVAGTSSTTIKTRTWSPDTSPSGSWDWYSGVWDHGFPFSNKILLGFHIVVEPLPASGTVQVYYQLDESGSWVSAGTISGTGTKNVFLPVSTAVATQKYKVLRVRMDGATGSKVLSLTGVSRITDKSETWQLALRMKDEQTARGSRPRNRKSRGHSLRDNLLTLAATNSVVTFLDGYRYKDPGGYTTHTVIIEFPQDRIGPTAEGTMQVTLRKVTDDAA